MLLERGVNMGAEGGVSVSTLDGDTNGGPPATVVPLPVRESFGSESLASVECCLRFRFWT
jgi:hypothetical protein